MPPPYSTENLLIRVLQNIQTGAHPVYPRRPASVLEHFVQANSQELKSLIIKKWDDLNHSDIGQNDGTPPPRQFSERIIKGVFDELPGIEHQRLEEDLNDRWLTSKRKYRQQIIDLYGLCDAEEITNNMSSVLHPIIATLGVMTNLNFNLWAGGPINKELGLISMNNNAQNAEGLLIISKAEKTSFERAARVWMERDNNHFVDVCIEAVAGGTSFPSDFFDSSSQPCLDGMEGVRPTPVLVGESRTLDPPEPQAAQLSPSFYIVPETSRDDIGVRSGMFTPVHGPVVDRTHESLLTGDSNTFTPPRTNNGLQPTEALEEVDQCEMFEDLEYIDEDELNINAPATRDVVVVSPLQSETPVAPDHIDTADNVITTRNSTIFTALPQNSSSGPVLDQNHLKRRKARDLEDFPIDSDVIDTPFQPMSPPLRRSQRTSRRANDAVTPHAPSPSLAKQRRTCSTGR